MSFKKSDWLRHIYHEAVKWQSDLKGQVSWPKQGDVSDPNNGTKLKSSILEAKLTSMLQGCFRLNKVPYEYVKEVTLFLEYVKSGGKIDSRVKEAVAMRKKSICLKETMVTVQHLKEEELDSVVAKLDELQDIEVVQKLILIDGDGGQAPLQDGNKPFKLIDWLRHIYICCQKWMGDEKGQVHWKDRRARDPNNCKDGSKTKLDDLKMSTEILIPECIERQIVPKKYIAELELYIGKKGDMKALERESNLRKVTGQLEDMFCNLKFDFDEVVSNIDPSCLGYIKFGAQLLSKALKKAKSGLDLGDVDSEQMQQWEEDGTTELLKVLEQNTTEVVDLYYEQGLLASPVHLSMDCTPCPEVCGPVANLASPVGSSFSSNHDNEHGDLLSSAHLTQTFDEDYPPFLKLHSPVAQPSSHMDTSSLCAGDWPTLESPVFLPSSPSVDCTANLSDFQYLHSPCSQSDTSSVDPFGYTSSDSGIHSPGLLLSEAEEEELLQGIDTNDLDYDVLPDIDLPKDDCEENLIETFTPRNSAKRKLSEDDGEDCVPKKAKP